MRMPLQEDRDRRFGYLTGRDAAHQFEEFFRVDRQLEAVQAQKYQCHHQARALIPIDEWMIANDVKQVCGGHLEQVGMEKIPVECRLRRAERGLQKGYIAKASLTPVTPDLVRVDRQNLIECEERGVVHSAKRLNTPP